MRIKLISLQDIKWRRHAVLGLFVAIFVVAVTVQFFLLAGTEAESGKTDGKPHRALRAMLPSRIDGGTVSEEAIATTEEMKRAVGELLNFNDAICRTYKVREMEVAVYAAWWSRGRMSSRLVAAHTPDVCWPGNGWARDLAAEANIKTLSDTMKKMDFAEGQIRVFCLRDKREHVIYWHKVNRNFISYAEGQSPRWWTWLDELRRYGLGLKVEQLFVRVAANEPLETIWSRAEFGQLRDALLDLGLRQERL